MKASIGSVLYFFTRLVWLSIAYMWLFISKSIYWKDVAEDNNISAKKIENNHLYCDHCNFDLHLSI